MKYKAIHTEKGKILVDGSAKLITGDWHIEKGLIINQFPDYLTDLDECEKIIATINFSIDKDVPMIIIEDEVEKLAEHSSEVQEGTYTPPHKTTYKHGFIDGFKAAQQKGVYSLDDVHRAIDLARKEPRIMIGDITQPIKHEYVELETEYAIADYEPTGCDFPDHIEVIKTTRVDGQLMAVPFPSTDFITFLGSAAVLLRWAKR